MRHQRPAAAAALALLASVSAAQGLDDRLARAIGADPGPPLGRVDVDWLVHPVEQPAVVAHGDDPRELVLDNGLVRRVFRLAPDAATVAFDDLRTGASLLRGPRPEARVTLDGVSYAVGGLVGQPEHGYLLPEWLDAMTPDPAAFHFVGGRVRALEPRLEWARVRPARNDAWPPKGVVLELEFAPPGEALAGFSVVVHHALYDGMPLVAKWLTLHNGTERDVRVDAFVSEELAFVEAESDVEGPDRWRLPNVHVESDYAFGGFRPESCVRTAHWVPDPQHSTQVNYRRRTPNLLVVEPPQGPDVVLAPGESLETFRTWILVHDSWERERQGLGRRRMMRALAPWSTENPTIHHVRSADPDAVRLAIEQCADVGFDMVILTFGSGFDIEDERPETLARWKALADHAHERGVQLGGYSLFSSRRISDEHDVIDSETGAPGGAKFGHAPCVGSEWGLAYYDKLERFFDATGFDVLEHDGPYPGDLCASTAHPGHVGLNDSQWRQWERVRDFYRRCRARGVYLNVPDWYFLVGSSKTGMGYRETNWSLPRERQIVLGRQNVYDGTWEKTPSMGWMFVPLTEYHGGGAAATLEPLVEHLATYEAHLANNLGHGVQACWRGPRLHDAPETRALVARWVDFHARYRRVLEGDVIHVRRPDGRDLDAMLHVDPGGDPCGLLAVHNPTDETLQRNLTVPLYYTGLDDAALVRRGEGEAFELTLDREYEVELPVTVEPRSYAWWLFEAP